jgi:hypothetical protein
MTKFPKNDMWRAYTIISIVFVFGPLFVPIENTDWIYYTQLFAEAILLSNRIAHLLM